MNILGGVMFIAAGIFVVVFHDAIREARDSWNERDPFLKWGDWWTGKYTKGGLLFIRGVIILGGLVLIAMGVALILSDFK